jgi:hypothetical protein
MRYVKAVAIAIVAALAIYGGLSLGQGARELYADWAFLRQARLEQIARQQQAAREQAARQAAPRQPAPADPPARNGQ